MAMFDIAADAAPETLARYDAIIDVRSPAEFEEDSIPGAVNLPVLSDQERAEVGTIYKQTSKFRARQIGAAYVSRNIARHLDAFLAVKPSDFRPLVYCWRGGMRSAAMATVLAEIGWRVSVLKGGYKTWRRRVIAALRQSQAPLNIVLLDGQTGAAKSDILRRLHAFGVQTIDLEGLARHRGSVFGALAGERQPSQKGFESALYARLCELDAQSPIVVEAESNRIGRCEIPKRLWRAMAAAPRIAVHAAPAARAQYLVEVYADLAANTDAIENALDALAAFHSKACVENWREMARRQDRRGLAASLMREHYDPLYDRSRRRRADKPLAEIDINSLDAAGVGTAARGVAEIVQRMQGLRRTAS